MKFITRFLGKQRPAAVPFAPVATENPVWVLGDIHGRDDLLGPILEAMDQHPATTEATQIVAVGDYIDRGDNSAAVLKRVHARSRADTRFHTLMGNHEAMMLDFLDRPEKSGARWLRYGGLQTLASFGIGGLGEASRGAALTGAAEQLRDALPDGLEDWMRARPTIWTSGNLSVVHAAADPELPIALQPDDTLIWGHPAFATTPRADQHWIAHGHTITDTPGSDGQGRIAVDTGAYYSGRLTAALVTPDGQVELLHS